MSENLYVMPLIDAVPSERQRVGLFLGGGGGGGGSVVQYTAPSAASQAAQFNVAAADEASKITQNSISDAIATINHQYDRAQANVQPWSTEGVQALDQINQYLGLNSYNPGQAPTAPVMPTKDTVGVDDQSVQDYIHTHSIENPNISERGNYPGWTNYFGVGAVDNSGTIPTNGNFGFNTGQWSNTDPAQNTTLQGTVKDYLQQQALTPAMKQYNSSLPGYQQDLQNYNTNLDLYNQYSAQGPFNAQQVQDKITNLPGYQAQLDQGVGAIDASAASKGYLGSGRLLKELNTFGQNTLSTFYGNELGRLANLAGMGQNAVTNQASSMMNQGNQVGQQQANAGTSAANAALASGNALAQAAMASGQQFQTMGGGGDSGLGGIGSLLSGAGSLIGAFNV